MLDKKMHQGKKNGSNASMVILIITRENSESPSLVKSKLPLMNGLITLAQTDLFKFLGLKMASWLELRTGIMVINFIASPHRQEVGIFEFDHLPPKHKKTGSARKTKSSHHTPKK